MAETPHIDHKTDDRAFYNVYLVTYAGLPRDHHAILIHEVDGAGRVYQVTGNIQEGLSFETSTEKPEESAEFPDKTQIGTVTAANNQRIEGICQNVPSPKKHFDGHRRLYPTEKIRRCQQWNAETIEALRAAEVLQL